MFDVAIQQELIDRTRTHLLELLREHEDARSRLRAMAVGFLRVLGKYPAARPEALRVLLLSCSRMWEGDEARRQGKLAITLRSGRVNFHGNQQREQAGASP